MALISVMSAKGAPGATTTALLLANLWPAPSVLVDADPLGGDVALRLMSQSGRALDQDRGLMSLLPPARRGLSPEMVAQHAQVAYGGQLVVAGLPGPEQSVAAAPLWPALAKAFGAVPDRDVVADLGQVHGRSAHLAMVEQSDVLVCVFRPSAWSVIHTSRRLLGLAELARSTQLRVGIVGVGGQREAEDLRNGAASIVNRLDWVEDLGTISLDPKAVAMYEGGTTHRPERTMLVRSAREVADRLYESLGQTATPVEPAPKSDAGSGPGSGAESSPASGRGSGSGSGPASEPGLAPDSVHDPAPADPGDGSGRPGATGPSTAAEPTHVAQAATSARRSRGESRGEFRGISRGGRRRAGRRATRS